MSKQKLKYSKKQDGNMPRKQRESRKIRPTGSKGRSSFGRKNYAINSYFQRELKGHTNYAEVAKRMVKLAKVSPKDVVLDVGAGTGFGTWSMFPLEGVADKSLVRPKEYIAVERHRAMAQGLAMYLASPKGKKISTYQPLGKTKLRKGTEIKIGKAENLGRILGNKKVDKVFMSNALHWTNQQETLKAVRQVINPNGLFAFNIHHTMHGPIQSPASGTFFEKHPFALKFKASVSSQLKKMGFQNTGLFGEGSKIMYSFKTLMKDLKEAGFKIEKTERIDHAYTQNQFESWSEATKMWFDTIPRAEKIPEKTRNRIIENAFQEAKSLLSKGRAISTNLIFICRPV